MEEKKRTVRGCSSSNSNKHVLMIPYPSQGHLNPMLQFSKRLSTKGVKVTMVTTIFISKTMHLKSSSLPSTLQFDFISDGYDQGGFAQANNISTYLSHMETIGSNNLKELIKKYNFSNDPIDCVIYDPLIYWVLDVAKEFGLLGAAFFTQMSGVNYIYYYVHHGLLKLPISSMTISIQGLPLLDIKDTPSFVNDPGFYPAYYELVMNQFSNIHKADVILVNSFYKLEDKVFGSLPSLYIHSLSRLYFFPHSSRICSNLSFILFFVCQATSFISKNKITIIRLRKWFFFTQSANGVGTLLFQGIQYLVMVG